MNSHPSIVILNLRINYHLPYHTLIECSVLAKVFDDVLLNTLFNGLIHTDRLLKVSNCWIILSSRCSNPFLSRRALCSKAFTRDLDVVGYCKSKKQTSPIGVTYTTACQVTDNIPRETAISILCEAGRIEEATWIFRQGEVKDISVFQSMIQLYSRNKKYPNEKMRRAGYFPNSNVIALALNAYGKLREFERASLMYKEMQEEGCIFPDEVHFQMLSLYGAQGDFETLESLFKLLDGDPNINKKELHLVVSNIYESSNRLNDAARIVNKMTGNSVCSTSVH